MCVLPSRPDEQTYEWMNKTGHMIGQRYGLQSDGLFNTQAELEARPENTYTGNRATLGDIRYKDLDGDGKINQNDVGPIGFPNYAMYHFSFKVQLGYRGFDLKLLFIPLTSRQKAISTLRFSSLR